MFRPFLKVKNVLEIVLSDSFSFCITLIRSRTALAAEKLFRAQTAGLISGTRKESQSDNGCRSFRAFQARSFLLLAQRLDHREASYIHRLASSWFPLFLALEVATDREATSVGRD